MADFTMMTSKARSVPVQSAWKLLRFSLPDDTGKALDTGLDTNAKRRVYQPDLLHELEAMAHGDRALRRLGIDFRFA